MSENTSCSSVLFLCTTRLEIKLQVHDNFMGESTASLVVHLHHRISPVAQERLVIKKYWVNKVIPKLWIHLFKKSNKAPAFRQIRGWYNTYHYIHSAIGTDHRKSRLSITGRATIGLIKPALRSIEKISAILLSFFFASPSSRQPSIHQRHQSTLKPRFGRDLRLWRLSSSLETIRQHFQPPEALTVVSQPWRQHYKPLSLSEFSPYLGRQSGDNFSHLSI
jgi:hypothetical protein